MPNHQPNTSRRHFLTLSVTTTLLGLIPQPSYANTIREIQGQVRVNNVPATLDTPIQPGDTIKTGPNSQIIFVIGEDAYQLGAHTTLRFRYNPGNSFVNAMRLITGTLLGVFGKGRKTIQSPTASLGIRGTGLFIQIEPNNTYFCTCYGETEIITNSTTRHLQPVTATHHQAYSISHDIENPIIYSDIMKSHTDEELHHLESLVGRQPPANFK